MKTRKRKVFERVVSPIIIKHLVSAHAMMADVLRSGIPIKYLSYFKESIWSKKCKED